MRKTPGSPIEHPTGIAAGRVLIGGLAGLTLAVCLNASSLLAEAKRLPDSASRSASCRRNITRHRAGSFEGNNRASPPSILDLA